MTRSGLRNLTILLLLCFVASAMLLWWQVQKQQVRIVDLNGSLTALQAELANLTTLVEAQDKLDALTMDERRSTQLDVLRYLGLERMKLDFRIDSREQRSAGDAELIVRNLTVQARQPYQEIMALIDKLFASGSFNIVNISLQRGDEGVPESVNLNLQGRIFSLQKQGLILNEPAIEVEESPK